MKYTISRRPNKKQLDPLWTKAVKLRAHMKSEYRHIPDAYIAAHHIEGKATLAMRYSLDNGVCVTTGQHKFIAHTQGRAKRFREWALKKRGVTEEYLNIISRNRIDMFTMKIYLQQQIKKYEAALVL